MADFRMSDEEWRRTPPEQKVDFLRLWLAEIWNTLDSRLRDVEREVAERARESQAGGTSGETREPQ